MPSVKKTTPERTKATKQPPKKKARGEYVTGTEAEEMYKLYIQIKDVGKGGGFKGVAAAFGRDIKTVRRVAERNKWDERHQKHLEEIRKHTDRKILKEEISNLKLARHLRDKVLRELLRSNKDINPRVHEAIEVMRYMDELEGNLPTEVEDTDQHITKDQVETALAAFVKMGTKAIEALGEELVKRAKEHGDNPN